MIALLQRVSQANVTIANNQTIAQIKQGLLVFVGVEKADTPLIADRLYCWYHNLLCRRIPAKVIAPALPQQPPLNRAKNCLIIC